MIWEKLKFKKTEKHEPPELRNHFLKLIIILNKHKKHH